jgi:hypothetical protein
MKSNLKIGLNIVCAILLLTSCANSYIHNSFRTPTFNDSVKTTLSTGIGTRHLELNVAHSLKKNLFIMATAYAGNKDYKYTLDQLYGDVNVGFQKPISKKSSFGAYYTIGAGRSQYEYFIFNTNSSYYKNSASLYIKKNQGVFRGFIGLRGSYVNYSPYKNIDTKGGWGWGWNSTNTTGYDTTYYKHINDYLVEPCIGFDLVGESGLSFGLQNICTFSQSKLFEEHAYLYSVFKLTVGYNFKSRKHKKAY